MATTCFVCPPLKITFIQYQNKHAGGQPLCREKVEKYVEMVIYTLSQISSRPQQPFEVISAFAGPPPPPLNFFLVFKFCFKATSKGDTVGK